MLLARGQCNVLAALTPTWRPGVHDRNDVPPSALGKPLPEDGRVPKRLVSIAQPVVSLIVEMDDAARAVPTDPDPIDFDEVLAYVVIRAKHHQVRLLTVVDCGSSFCKSAPILI
jgi:hypothetical protein